MTTLNTIIEEEKKEAKQKWEEIVTFCQKRKDGPSVLMHENFLDDTLTTAMQRAYEAGQREANAKWEREVEGMRKKECDEERDVVLSNGANVRGQTHYPGNVGWNRALDTLLSKIRS